MTYHTAENLNLAAIERPASERGTFPRYLVMADGKMTTVKTPRALAKLLGSIYSKAPHIFVNAGKGITLDFDQA